MNKSFSAEVPEQTVRVAWLYYVGGYQQGQIAKFLGISCREVLNNLAAARRAGIVAISVEHRFAHTVEIAESLRRKYQLGFCQVTPPLAAGALGSKSSTCDEPKAFAQSVIARRSVGVVAAQFLGNKLRSNESCIVGTSWGRTISQVPGHLAGISAPDAKFVSILGSLRPSFAINPLEVTTLLAQATGGEGYFLPVPFIAETTAHRRALMEQIVVQEALAVSKQATFCLVDLELCGVLGPLIEQGHLSEAESFSLQRAGAICSFVGKFYDARGCVVDHELNGRTLAVDLDQMRHLVLLAAGREKLAAVRGLLEAGYIYGLIIDGDSAIQLENVR